MSNKNIVVIVQTRMGSSRLPGKSMMEICGKPILEHIVQRIKCSKSISEIVIATTNNEIDDTIVLLSKKLGVKSYRGSENDVLDRYYQCAKMIQADILVRITGDCPLIDPDIIDLTIHEYLKSPQTDYLSNNRPVATFPDGLDVEVFSYKAIEKAWLNAKRPSEREHVTPYIWENRDGSFHLGSMKNDVDLSSKRWTLDYMKDLMFIQSIYESLYKDNSVFKFKDILAFLEKHPELEIINAGSKRDEGYLKSLEKDTEVI